MAKGRMGEYLPDVPGLKQKRPELFKEGEQMINRLKIKFRKGNNPGLLHNSREDCRNLGKVCNALIDKVNELVDEVNELKQEGK